MDPSGGGRQGNLKRPAGDLGNSDSTAQSGVVGASSSHDRPPVQWSPGVGAGYRDYDRSIVRDDGYPELEQEGARRSPGQAPPPHPAAFWGRLPLSPQSARSHAATLHAPAQKADGAAAGAQGGVSPPPVATDREGDQPDQSNAPGVGELLRGGALKRVLQRHQRLGREEGQAPSGAGSETKGLRLGAVE